MQQQRSKFSWFQVKASGGKVVMATEFLDSASICHLLWMKVESSLFSFTEEQTQEQNMMIFLASDDPPITKLKL